MLLLVACAAPPVLDQPSNHIPDNIDLSGRWSLQVVEDVSRPRAVTDELIIPRDRRQPVRRSTKAEPGSAARLFLESGNELKITQAESALFVSFDRSIVEEYRFGVLREITIGPVTAQRSTGWEGDSLVVRTLDEDGALMTEVWTLNGDELSRQVTLTRKEKTLMTARQIFDRQ